MRNDRHRMYLGRFYFNMLVNHFRNYLVQLVTCLGVASCCVYAIPVFAQETSVFQLITEFELSDEVLLGALGSVDVSENNELLLVDATSSDVHVFKINGLFSRTLEIKGCDPGLQWDPIRAYWIENGNVIVINGGRPGLLLFDASGKCVSSSEKSTPPPTHIAVCPDGKLFGLFPIDDEFKMNPSVYRISASGQRQKKIYSPSILLPNITRRVSQLGGLTCSHNTLIFGQPSSPVLELFSTDGVSIGTIDAAPEEYYTSKEDLSNELDFGDVLKKWAVIKEKNSFLLSLFLVNSENLILQYQHGRSGGYSIVLVHLATKRVEYFSVEWPYSTGNANQIFRLKNAVIDSEGNLPNPSIQIFKVK